MSDPMARRIFGLVEPVLYGSRQRPMRIRSILAGTLVLPLLWCLPAQASTLTAHPGSPPASVRAADDSVRSLIVRYERGYVPRGTVLGAGKVTGSQRNNLVLGDGLGERMWRVDFKVPVSKATAQRVARQLASSAAVEFAELDAKVTALRKARGSR